ncbi:MAG TPA: hypothetical protein VFW11_03045 [Cyclobacteriaceae bacterium]|nr:hypothetical protein [Cyclobacteriaceae bacterium]
MKRAFFVIISFCFLISACTQRTICPAFQSAYIYDKEELRRKFSYFEEDSTPKILTASKNKYLVAEAVPYRRKLARLATVEMKDVQPVVPDSLTMDEYVSQEELDAAARSVIDSTYIVDVPTEEDTVATEEESEYMITKDKEVRVLRFNSDSVSYKVDEVRYNTDQDNYMWYLRDALVLPDIRLAQLHGQAEEEAAKKEKKGISGFFKNLFKKKEKKEEIPVDSTEMEPAVERSEYDLDYVENEEPEVKEVQKEKKGLFKRKNKEEGKVSSGSQPADKPKKEKKPKKVKPKKSEVEKDEKPADEEVKGNEGF